MIYAKDNRHLFNDNIIMFSKQGSCRRDGNSNYEQKLWKIRIKPNILPIYYDMQNTFYNYGYFNEVHMLKNMKNEITWRGT